MTERHYYAIFVLLVFALWQHLANGFPLDILYHAVAWSIGIIVAALIFRSKEPRP